MVLTMTTTRRSTGRTTPKKRTAKAAGYSLPRRTAVLTFEDTPFDGAEIRMSLNTSIAAYLEAMTLGDLDVPELVEYLTERIESWNLVDPDTAEPVPVTVEGFMSLDDPRFPVFVAAAWEAALAGKATVDVPLGQPSRDGGT